MTLPVENPVFVGQTVLITGAAGGFGRSASQLFAEHGANLVLSDFNDEGLLETADLLQSDGVDVATLSGSVAEEAHCRQTVELAMDRFGRLDIAINNAGISHAPARIAAIDSDEASMTVQVNLMGVFFGMKHQIPVMEAAFRDHDRQSSILNIASLAGIGGAPTLSIYAAAKHGVVGLTKSAALEYARRGIRINALCPAFARTPMVEDGLLADAGGDKQAEEYLTRGIPMRRLAEPEEITRSMLWICDPRNSFMTGQAIALDGGTSAM
jgi:NAD(P)-dependent dehydrogenase (short-subunit alcohol dehydrogenase family)